MLYIIGFDKKGANRCCERTNKYSFLTSGWSSVQAFHPSRDVKRRVAAGDRCYLDTSLENFSRKSMIRWWRLWDESFECCYPHTNRGPVVTPLMPWVSVSCTGPSHVAQDALSVRTIKQWNDWASLSTSTITRWAHCLDALLLVRWIECARVLISKPALNIWWAHTKNSRTPVGDIA